MLVHAQVDDLVRETRVAAVLLDHEQRRRLLAAPVASRSLRGVEAVEQPLGERALRAFEGLGDRIDGLGRDEDVALCRVAVSGAAAGPLHALRAGVAGGARLCVDDSELSVVASV